MLVDITRQYTTLKPFLFAVAYNMTGQVQEAEDIVQDTFTDILTRQPTEIQNLKSFLTRIVINKAIDRLNALKKQRESYPSMWLPEPYISQSQSNEDTDILPYVFLHIMEELNALERAIYILREAFDYSYDDISVLTGTTAENCRQVLHRTKLKLKTPRALNIAKTRTRENEKILHEFLKACLDKDATQLAKLLKEDVVLFSDGGGKVRAARRTLSGISGVAKFLLGIARKTFEKWSTAKTISVNGAPALLVPDEDGVYMILIPQIQENKMVQIFIMRNPDKIYLKKSVTN